MTKLSGRAAFALLAVCLAACPFPTGSEWTAPIPAPPARESGDFILNYNLQAYVQAPVRGAAPVKTIANRADMDITVVWKNKDGERLGDDFTVFVRDVVYTADITLTAREGYTFAPIPFRYYPETAVDVQPAENDDATRRVLTTIKYHKTADPNSLNPDGLNLSLRIPAPAGGASPVTSFYAGDYGGSVTWKTAGGADLRGAFRAGMVYTAQVTLYAAAGYTLGDGLAFTYPGGTLNPSAEWDNNQSTITGMLIAFPQAVIPPDGPVTDRDLADKVPAPVMGGVPVTYFAAPQYTGTVTWTRIDDDEKKPHTGLFQADVVYEAAVTLAAASGYDLSAGNESFWHSGPVSTVSTPAAGNVTIVFKATTNVGVEPVDDLDLTAKVPAPASGGTPLAYFSAAQYTGNVAWTETGKPGATLSGFFQAGLNYTATVHLTAASGYTLNNVPGFEHEGAAGTVSYHAADREVSINFLPAREGQTPVTDKDLADKVAAPAAGGKPVRSFSATQYTGNVTWAPVVPDAGVFASGTTYTATVRLTAASGYTFTGFTPTYSGEQVTGNGEGGASELVIDITFPETAKVESKPVDDTDLAYMVSRPVMGGTPVTYFATPQYTGTIKWSPDAGVFAAYTAYTATVALTAVYPYTLDGMAANSFTHENKGAASVKYDAGNKTVTIVFEKTVPTQPVTDLDLAYKFPAPVKGGKPAAAFAAAQYTGSVVWTKTGETDEVSGVFEAGQPYTATVKLTPASGYYFGTGTAANFVYTGAPKPEVVTGKEDEIVFNIRFPATTDETVTQVNKTNLTSTVIRPGRGETPVRHFSTDQYTGSVVWTKTGETAEVSGVFEAGQSYTATVTLTAVYPYTLDGVEGFTHTNSTQPYHYFPLEEGDKVIIPFPATTYKTSQVSDLDLTLKLIAPKLYGTPVRYFPALQYTGDVEWQNVNGSVPHTGAFAAKTAYKATVILAAAPGYTFTGLADDSFKHAGAASVTPGTNNGTTITVTIVFAATGNPLVNDLDLTGSISRPAAGEKPPTGKFFAAQYEAEAIKWRDIEDPDSWDDTTQPFGYSRQYAAEVTLKAKDGWTFDGLPPAAFFYSGASVVTGQPEDAAITVTITFPNTEPSSPSAYPSPPVSANNVLGDDGVLDWITKTAAAAEIESLTLVLDPAAEDVSLTAASSIGTGIGTGGLVLKREGNAANYTSPPAVLIDGQGKTVSMTGASNGAPLITVGEGVTLMLKDITFKGMAANSAPLIRVETGGTLIFQSGACITGNESSTNGGGVYVNNGGAFKMQGGTISGNKAFWGGGVYVNNGGAFNMTAGIIYGQDWTDKGEANDATMEGDALYQDGSGASIPTTNNTLTNGQEQLP
jgi:hypothetical protein